MKKNIITLTLVALLSSSTAYAQEKLDDPISKEDMARANIEVELPSPATLVLRLHRALGDVEWREYMNLKQDSKKNTKQDFAFYLGAKGADAYFLSTSKDTTNLISTSKNIYKSINKLKVNDKSTKKILRNLKRNLGKSKVDEATWKNILKDIIQLKDQISNNLNSKYKDGDKTILYDVGGWLEGYRLSAQAIKDNYSSKISSILIQKNLVSSLLKRVKGSNKAKKFSGYNEIVATLKDIDSTLSNSKNRKLTKTDVDKLVETLSKIQKYM